MFGRPYLRRFDAVSSRPARDFRLRSQLFALFVFIAIGASAHAQGHPGGGGGGFGGMGGGGAGSPGGGNRSPFPGNNHTWPSSNPNSPSGGDAPLSGSSLQLGPAGRWWDNKDFARTLRIDSVQQRRMDEVFTGNRDALLKLYKNLQHEESQLSKTVRAKELDEAQIFTQIDRVTQARGELEKANAHMLLQLRKELTAEQTAKLDDYRPTQ